jgi:hypothetical protein
MMLFSFCCLCPFMKELFVDVITLLTECAPTMD